MGDETTANIIFALLFSAISKDKIHEGVSTTFQKRGKK